MMRAKTIVLSLSGPGSHTILEEPGRGDLCIGPESSGTPSPDVLVGADETLNWSTFEPLKVPAGYSWPRHFHYRGNDRGFFTWSERRRIETFEWTPLTDTVVNARDARIDHLVLHLNTASLEIVLPSYCKRLTIMGEPSRLRAELSSNATCPALEFHPSTKPSPSAAPITLPRFGTLVAALSVDVYVEPLRQPFDCASLLLFPRLQRVALRGQLTGLEALAQLPDLKSLELRYCADLSALPPLNVWPELNYVIGWNIEKSAGKRLQAEIKQLTKTVARKWDFASITQLRSPEWFTAEYGLPFSAWPKRHAKTAIRAYQSAQESIATATSSANVEQAIRVFVRTINSLPSLETTEREDSAEAVAQLIANAKLRISVDLARSWFDDERKF
jgi:hypothetical protein